MDEAGARARIHHKTVSPDFAEMEEKLAHVQAEKEKARSEELFEKAAGLLQEERQLRSQLDAARKAYENEVEKSAVRITEREIAQVLSALCGVPVRQMEEGELKHLICLEADLGKEVIGQEEAVSVVAKALRRSGASLKDPERPIGSFIFLGPTGVGKTLLAKSLAREMFGSADSLIQIDMSEYMEKFNVSRLVGSPPGYVGHGEGGELTERVRRHPYSGVLFDEIEKAHPDVMHMLLQILEEGRLTDTLGRRVDFRNTVIIMTSNLGAEQLSRGGSLGFFTGAPDREASRKDQLLQQVKRNFKPEFINRVDELVVFRSLDRDDLRKIVQIETGKLIQRMQEQKLTLHIAPEVVEFLLEKSWQPEYGARPVRRTVERELEDVLALKILEGDFKKSKEVFCFMKDGKVDFSTELPFTLSSEECLEEKILPSEDSGLQKKTGMSRKAKRKSLSSGTVKKSSE